MGFWDMVVVSMHEQQQAERERQRERVEAKRQAQQLYAENLNYVHEALVYWATIAQDLDGYIAAHWRTILENEEEMIRACHDINGPFHNPTRRFLKAAVAIKYCQDQLVRLLPLEDRGPVISRYKAEPWNAVERLIYIFERYHADPVERLLPGARRMRDEFEGLVSGGPSDPSDPLAGLTRTDRSEFTRRLQAVSTLRGLDLVLDEEHATYLSALDRREVAPAERTRLIEKNRANLNKLKQDFAAERGLLA